MYDIYLYKFSKNYLEDLSYLKETRHYTCTDLLSAASFLEGKSVSQASPVTDQEKIEGISAEKNGWYVNIYHNGHLMTWKVRNGFWYSKGYIRPRPSRRRRCQTRKVCWKQYRSIRRKGWLVKAKEKNRQIILSVRDELDFSVPSKWTESTDFICFWDPPFRSTKGRSWKNQKIGRQWQKNL